VDTQSPIQVAKAITLLIPSNRVNDRPFIALFSPNHIKSHTENERCSKENTTPIHCDWSHDFGGGEEAEEHGNRSINKANDIHKRAEDRTHVPRTPA
jgi:hypothetical protein